MAVLSTLSIKGRAPKTGYDRDQFGANWADADRNGCDTRNDILSRDLTGQTFRPGTRDCVVLSGVLLDPYTARTVTFSKADASAVQIDHVVSLSNACLTANLLAIELYGHGETRASYGQFTYWDTAVANLQVLEALGISAALVLGTSQGGWVGARVPSHLRLVLM